MEQELLHIIARLGVESAKWFVHQEDFGFDDESAGNCDTLLHTARQLVWWVPFEACNQIQKRRFPAAAGTTSRDELVVVDGHRNILQSDSWRPAPLPGIYLGNV